MKRRTLIWLLVGLGIGIPVAVELLTFFGLLRTHLFGEDDDESGGGDAESGVTPGDEILDGTPQTEEVESSFVVTDESYWTFRFAVTVTNDTDEEYSIRLGNVTVEGEEVEGDFSASVPPGEVRTVEGEWRVPTGALPRSVEVTAEHGGARVEEDVLLGNVPVRGTA